MALNWNWEDKMGEVIFADDQYHPDHPYKTSIYQGNALMIWCNEFPDDTYSLSCFFSDMEHLKNFLGLNVKKGYGSENLLDDGRVKTIRLNTRYKSVPKILEAARIVHEIPVLVFAVLAKEQIHDFLDLWREALNHD